MSTTRLNVIRLSDVTPEDVSWLWNPYIPLGKLTILEGDPESGKSYLSLAIAAHVTQGDGLPAYGMQPPEKRDPRNVLLLTAEDGLADTVLPRFLKVRGDSTRVFQLAGVLKTDKDGKEAEFSLTLDSVQHIDAALTQYKPKLVVVDPFQSFLGSHIDMHRANEVRPVLDGLAKLAAKHGCAILLIRHLRKDPTGGANARGMGSIDIRAAARSVLLAGKNPQPPVEVLEIDTNGALQEDTKTRCVFAQTKCSLSKAGPSITYVIDENGLTLGRPVVVTADDILLFRPKLTSLPDVEEWLTNFLASGPKSAAVVKAAAANAGWSGGQIGNAAKKIRAERKPAGFGGEWSWALPASALVSVAEQSAVSAVAGETADSAVMAAGENASAVTAAVG